MVEEKNNQFNFQPPIGKGPMFPPPVGPPQRDSKPIFESFEASFETILRWAGVILISLGTLFFVSAAIARNWISPEVQLLAASLIGALMFYAAFVVNKERPAWAHALAQGGTVIIVSCATATYAWLYLVNNLGGLILLGIAMLISIAVAKLLDLELVAIVAGVVSHLMLVWFDIGEQYIYGWISLALIATVIIGIAFKWSRFRLGISWMSAAYLVLYLTNYEFESYTSRGLLLALVMVSGFALWASPFSTIYLAQSRNINLLNQNINISAIENRLTMAVPGWVFLCTVGLFRVEGHIDLGKLAVSIAIGFALMSLLSAKISENLFLSHLFGASTLGLIGTVLWIDGPVLLVALAFQGLGAIMVAYQFKESLMRISGYSVLGLASFLSLQEILQELGRSKEVTIESHVSNFLVGAALVIAAFLTNRFRETLHEESSNVINAIALGYSHLFVASAVIQFIHPDATLMLALVLSCSALFIASKLEWLSLVFAGLAVWATGFYTLAEILLVLEEGGSRLLSLSHLLVLIVASLVGKYLWKSLEGEIRLLVFLGLWISNLTWLVSAFLREPQGQGAISLISMVAACALIVIGIRSDEAIFKNVGLATLGIAFIKLLTVDLVAVDIMWRVGLFLIVGGGLLRLGYLVPKLSRSRENLETATGSTPST